MTFSTLLPMAAAARAVRLMALTSVFSNIINETLPRIEVNSRLPHLTLSYSNDRRNRLLLPQVPQEPLIMSKPAPERLTQESSGVPSSPAMQSLPPGTPIHIYLNGKEDDRVMVRLASPATPGQEILIGKPQPQQPKHVPDPSALPMNPVHQMPGLILIAPISSATQLQGLPSFIPMMNHQTPIQIDSRHVIPRRRREMTTKKEVHVHKHESDGSAMKEFMKQMLLLLQEQAKQHKSNNEVRSGELLPGERKAKRQNAKSRVKKRKVVTTTPETEIEERILVDEEPAKDVICDDPVDPKTEEDTDGREREDTTSTTTSTTAPSTEEEKLATGTIITTAESTTTTTTVAALNETATTECSATPEEED